jgi:colanic acid/amylovoran biosynthesis glycosyltransferase
MLKILHVTSYFNVPSQTFINKMILLLSKKYRNNLLTTYIEGQLPSTIDEGCVVRKYRFNKSKMSFYNFFALLYLFYKKALRLSGLELYKLRYFIKKNSPDLIIVHFGWTFYEYRKLLEKIETPILICFHGSDVTLWKHNKEYIEEVRDFSEKKNVLYSTCSVYLKKQLVALGVNDKSIRLLHNTFSKTQSIKSHKNQNEFVILNVSRLDKIKGQTYLIEAFEKVLQKVEKASLVFVGAGPEEKPLKTKVRELGLEDKVIFKGELPHAEVMKEFSNADIYVQPSIKDETTGQEEAFGVVLLEAMNFNLPIIATKTGGIPEVLGNDTFKNKAYFLIPDKDPIHLADKLVEVFQNYDLETYSKYASERLNYFSERNYLDKLSEIIDSLLKNVHE